MSMATRSNIPNKFIDRLNTFVFQGGKRNRNFPLEKRIFNLITLYGGLAITFLIGPANFYLQLPWYAQAVNLFIGLLLLLLALISFTKDKQYSLTFLIVSLFFTDLLWFANGGSQGTISLFLGLHMIGTNILTRGKIRFYLSVFNLINVMAIIILEKFHTNLVVTYSSQEERFYDILIGHGVAGFILFLMINLVMKNYERERNELKEQNLVLEELSLKDHLTGLYNRRFQMARIKEEIQNFHRYDHPFSILLIDLDFFKKINDTWGHSEGDRILKEFAEILLNFLRINDISGRFGGEEFLIILPMTKLDEAANVAEKLRSYVQKNLLLPDGKPTTLSIGVEEYKNQLIADFIAKADKKLYRAKQLGRNRVIHFM